ncbi:MAG: 1-acyl-sn-glycerol-3-phosphate acyltransferase [Gemmatimonadetes bacterium]|nr:1-acyl-sn-glycerol-3-phosphate acyltransferase [Gemmatimonadota bacterium]
MSWLLIVAAVLVALGFVLWFFRRALRRWGARTVLEFRARLDRYKLTEAHRVKAALWADPIIQAAIEREAAARGDRGGIERAVRKYLDEIVPAFNVLSYYKFAFNVSRLLTRLFYKVTVGHHDARALARIPKRDGVVYLINHRSNMDYVVVTYLLAQVVSISYAVGEWARTWPLEYVFKSFGSYFVRRRFPDPLYHTVLERYVQLVTLNRVTQGIFPEGGLSRDGTLRPAKIGLLDYIVGTLRDPSFDGDLWLVPVAINYDRVLEDRTLTRELVVGAPRRSKLMQLFGWVGFAVWNWIQLWSGGRQRYGRVALQFAEPVSVRQWLAGEAPDVLDRPRLERLAVIQRLADLVMRRVGAVIPVTPVPFAAAALLSFPSSVVPMDALWDRLAELRDRLRDQNASIVRSELTVTGAWERAWRTFRSRRWVHQEGANLVILPNARPLLEYYANSIVHLLPDEARWHLTPAAGADESMPRLDRQAR